MESFKKERNIYICMCVSESELVDCQSTYEYGKQLLQAALVLRRSMHLELEPNYEQASRLAQAWRVFFKGVNEQSVRNNSAALFLQQSDDVSLTYLRDHLER